LDSTNYGGVVRGKRATRSLLKRLLRSQPLDVVLSVKWGTDNEEEGIKVFKMATGKYVQESGLRVIGSGILGASPEQHHSSGEGKVSLRCKESYHFFVLLFVCFTIKIFCIFKVVGMLCKSNDTTPPKIYFNSRL
jgi:hypothetical protein